MEKVKKNVLEMMSKDQRKLDVHSYIVDNGVVKIKIRLEELLKETLGLKLDEKKDWKKREKILKETLEGIDALLSILRKTTDDPIIRFRQCEHIFPLVFEIGKATCAITCKIGLHLSRRFSLDNKKFCSGIFEIPIIFDLVLAYLTPQPRTDLSDNATVEGVLKEEMIFCRGNLHESCIKFNIFVSKKIRTVLRIMDFSKSRSEEGFKSLLTCIVKQFFYVQRACGLAREILKDTTDDDWSSYPLEYNRLFKRIRSLLRFGTKALRSLSFDVQSSVDYKTMESVCKLIRQTQYSLRGYTYLESGTRSRETLNPLLKGIETVCFKIGETIESGTKCQPPGHIQIEEDVSVLISSDCKGSVQGNDENEQGSDSVEESASGNDIDDDNDDGEVENSSDFEGTLTKIPPEEIEDILKSSDIDRSEIINTYKMEGFESSVDVLVDHKSSLPCSVGGKVFTAGKWIPARNVKVEESQVSMNIEPGEFFVVHNEFPTHEKTFSKADVKMGATMSIPEAKCSIKISSTDSGGRALKCKVHLTDKERIKRYQEENPKKYNHITVSEGLQTRTKSGKVTGTVEFAEVNELETSIFVHMSTDSDFKNWNRDTVEPEIKKGKVVFNVLLNTNSTHYFVQTKDQTFNQGLSDPSTKQSFLKKLQNAFLTLLGFKSNCKLLTLYKVPEEIDDAIDLCVHCIESKGFDLSKQLRNFRAKKWMPIEDGDESSDFTIRSGDEISLEFRGNVTPIEGQHHPSITFLKNGSSFVRVQLQLLDSNDPKGYVSMYRKDNLLDWKRLVWGYLVKKYEVGDTAMRMDAQKEKLESMLKDDPQHILNTIFIQLSEYEKEQLKQELQMTAQKQDAQFMERLISRIQQQRKPLEYLAGYLRRIGQDDLLWNQMDSMAS